MRCFLQIFRTKVRYDSRCWVAVKYFYVHHNCSYTFALWSWCWAKDGVIAFHFCIPINPQHPQKSPDTRNHAGCVCRGLDAVLDFWERKVRVTGSYTSACVFCTVRVPCGERNFKAREGLQRLSMPAARRPQTLKARCEVGECACYHMCVYEKVT